MEIHRENRGKLVLPKRKQIETPPWGTENRLFTEKQGGTVHEWVNHREGPSLGLVLGLKGVRHGRVPRTQVGTGPPSPQRTNRLLRQKELMLRCWPSWHLHSEVFFRKDMTTAARLGGVVKSGSSLWEEGGGRISIKLATMLKPMAESCDFSHPA